MSSPYPPQYDPFDQQPPPQFPSPGGYYVAPQNDPYYGIRPPSTSGLAILSIIGGIASLLVCWVTFCCLFTPFVLASSGASILMGHLALSQIHHSNGTLVGRELAWVGLGTAYPAALVSGGFLAFWIFIFVSADRTPATPTPAVVAAPGETELEAAEQKISSAVLGTAQGNSPAAVALADKFNVRLQAQRDALAKQDSSLGISADDGNFITWCELREGRCAFIVHVPNYRNFAAEGEAKMERLAWTTAQEVAQGTLQENDQLAVGTKGVLLWGSVMVGKITPEATGDRGLAEEGEDYELLYPFFAPPNGGAAEELAPDGTGPIQLPPEGQP